jgi:hypothetical protein
MRIADDSAFVQKKQHNHLLCDENPSAGLNPRPLRRLSQGVASALLAWDVPST